MLEDIKVYRLIVSEQDRIGIATFQPEDEKNQDSTELTGDITDGRKDDFRREILNYIGALAGYYTDGQFLDYAPAQIPTYAHNGQQRSRYRLYHRRQCSVQSKRRGRFLAQSKRGGHLQHNFHNPPRPRRKPLLTEPRPDSVCCYWRFNSLKCDLTLWMVAG